MIRRRKSLPVHVGSVIIGGDAPISVQTMSTVNPVDTDAAVADAKRLAACGAEIIRFAVPNMAAATALKKLTTQLSVPLVADIHFDYRLALAAVESGIAALRINPGNIGSEDNVVAVVEKIKPHGIPIRIGINSGSLPDDILAANGGHPTASGMLEGALRHIRILEKMDYRQIVISLKSSDVPLMIEAYRTLAEKVPYALHLGVTEAGLAQTGTIRSAVGIGTLLYNGIGDTLRVSLTADPAEEIKVGQEILTSLGLRRFGPTLISCPTCGRTQVGLIALAKAVEERLKSISQPIKVAVMGCVVNGPGEAREADFGIAGGQGMGIVFSHGTVLQTVKEADLVDTLFAEINTYIAKES